MKQVKRKHFKLKKLKSADNVTATAEGFVFDYDGVTYKFTGNFAPVNQILGLFKYGRGKVPPIKKDSLQEKKDKNINEIALKLADVAVIPGAFKPPHKGHIDMIASYANMAKRVVVLVSPLPRMLPDNRPVSFETSKKIFDIFLSEAGIADMVEVLESPINSPVGASFAFVGNEEDKPEYAQKGETVILGTSTKGGDDSRFKANAQKYAREGVKVEVVPVKPFENLSATDMRKAISEKDIKSLMNFIPDDFGKEKKKIAEKILSMFSSDGITESLIYDIISETIKKIGDKYCLISKKNKKNLGCYDSKVGASKREKQVNYFKHLNKEQMSAGAVAGFPAKINNDKEE